LRNEAKFSDKQRKQIKHWKNKIKSANLYKRLEVLDYAAKGYTNKQISDLTDYTIRRISGLINEYLKNGIGYFLEEHRKGGGRQILTNKQEDTLLAEFKQRAIEGKIVRLNELKDRYDKLIGKETANSTFYDFLKRKKWRKVMPRGAHPKKANEAEIEASKKLTLN
jgi:transposase